MTWADVAAKIKVWAVDGSLAQVNRVGASVSSQPINGRLIISNRDPRSFTGGTSEISRTSRVFRWKTTKLCALCLIAGCLVFDRAGACTTSDSGTGILFDHVPDGIYEPVIAEVTILSKEAVITLPNRAELVVMNARVERVIRGTLDSDVLKVVTSLFSCSRVGVGHGFVAGTLEHDAQRGLELVAIQRPIDELVRGRANSDSLRRNTK